MTRSTAAAPVRNFDDHLALWLSLSHFLSAPLMEELAAAAVRVASGGRLQLTDLVETVVTPGPEPTSSWLLRLKAAGGRLEHFLQDVVRILAWQSDAALYPPTEQLDEAERKTALLIEHAFELGRVDLAGLADWEETARVPVVELAPLALAIKAAAKPPEADVDNWLERVERPIAALPKALRLLAIKHVGDLCAHDDAAAAASRLYAEAIESAEGCEDQWGGLAAAISDMARQSLAEMIRLEQGAEAAVHVLESALGSKFDPGRVSSLNAPLDLMNARTSARGLNGYEDIRPAILTAPQLYASNSLEPALGFWHDGKLRQAQQRFWAALRRRTALGTSFLTREARAEYGRFLLDHLQKQLSNSLDNSTFRLALQLLVTAGRVEAIAAEARSSELVAAYVDTESADLILSWARHYVGARNERMRVVVKLLEAWLLAIPDEKVDLAGELLRRLAEIARDESWSPYTPDDVARPALEALRAVAVARPELRRLSSQPVADAAIARVRSNQFLIALSALETLGEFMPALETPSAAAAVDAALEVLERTGVAESHGLVQPAIRLIASEAAQRLWPAQRETAARSARLIAEFGLSAQSNAIWLLHLMEEIQPYLEEPVLQDRRIATIVASLRRGAQKINSSGVSGDIAALLTAPRLIGREGFEDALKGLIAILESANAGHPSLGIATAYDPVMLLTSKRTEIAAALQLDDAQMAALTRPLGKALQQFWKAAAASPALLAPFSIPPKHRAHPTIVHNWAYATFEFAGISAESAGILKAINNASENPELGRYIEVARVVRLPKTDPAILSVDHIKGEAAEPFYAALGTRLAVLAKAKPQGREPIIAELCRQCLRLGPNGLDAGVWAIAGELGIRPPGEDSVVRLYKDRLSTKRELQRALRPLLDQLFE